MVDFAKINFGDEIHASGIVVGFAGAGGNGQKSTNNIEVDFGSWRSYSIPYDNVVKHIPAPKKIEVGSKVLCKLAFDTLAIYTVIGIDGEDAWLKLSNEKFTCNVKHLELVDD